MIELLPPGTAIGHMEAPYRWIFSHTTRFVGLVRIDIHDGQGFILINRGKPLKCYFAHGNRILWGHAAYDYFRNQPVIPFELHRYTNDELSDAIRLINREESRTPARILQEVISSARTGKEKSGEIPAGGVEENGLIPGTGTTPWGTTARTGEETGAVLPTGSDHVPRDGDQIMGTSRERSLLQETRATIHAEEPAMTSAGELLLGQLISVPGVIAVSIFSRRMNLLSLGDLNLDNLVDVAEDLLARVEDIRPLLHTGPLVQVTLQVPAGNLIIAPFFDEYLCILTSQEINLGQIRKILRDLPGKDYQEEEPPQ